ncbi:MAG TPA: hypothetical protein PLM72_12160, partial [Spirochaetota bacterium]|nr:hypothetical protein [Spirochaetota bacterium]
GLATEALTLLIFLHDPCETGYQRRQPLTTSPVAGQTGFKRCETPFDLSPNLGETQIPKTKSLRVRPTLGLSFRRQANLQLIAVFHCFISTDFLVRFDRLPSID